MNLKIFWCRSFAAVGWALLKIEASQAQVPIELTGCASQTPPFVMMKAGVGSTGYSVEYFSSVVKSMGRTGVIRELPWARCLRDVAAGNVDIAVDAYEDAERRINFLYSTPYYTLTPQVFFRSQIAGINWPAKSAAELAKHSGCGVHEYTYEHYGLDAKRMDRGAKSDKHMFLMLLAGRCDYAVEELEYVIGGRANAKDWPDESSLQSYRPEWAKAPQLHYLIGRKHPDAKMLQDAINLAIEGMEKSGEAKTLRSAYFSDVNAKRKATNR
jgi:polar amino acid transport system substrate-binding protein